MRFIEASPIKFSFLYGHTNLSNQNSLIQCFFLTALIAVPSRKKKKNLNFVNLILIRKCTFAGIKTWGQTSPYNIRKLFA